MGSYEWIIIEVLVVGFLVWELFSVRRSIRRAREADALKAANASAAPGTGASPAPKAP